jgi:hypothetical protein
MGSVEFAEPLGSDHMNATARRDRRQHATPRTEIVSAAVTPSDFRDELGDHAKPQDPPQSRAHKLEIAIANSGGPQTEPAPVNYFLEASPRVYLTKGVI